MTGWRVARNEPRKIISEHGLMIGRAVLHKSGPGVEWTEAEAEAHARLMSAAPDMLAALKIVSGLDIYHEALSLVDAAIAKAEGR